MEKEKEFHTIRDWNKNHEMPGRGTCGEMELEMNRNPRIIGTHNFVTQWDNPRFWEDIKNPNCKWYDL